MEEMMMLALLLCVGITLIGLKMKAWPVTFVSSIGLAIIALRLFQSTEDFLVLALMIAAAVGQLFMTKSAEG